ncbi:TSC22 domain family protein 1-like [Octodon degus]|uniref:TSC22 domain family protein 1 n=1 Tax=Octodon degus TaxID=10160 RepID=A0A6P6DH78_OCTDE|nr:TSC22 domain family protein 1-like [Octodon degus]
MDDGPEYRETSENKGLSGDRDYWETVKIKSWAGKTDAEKHKNWTLDSSLPAIYLLSSGASVVAINNKTKQATNLLKGHLMYAVREEVEVLKEQIKELIEKNSQLEKENNLLKTLASPEQLAQFQAQLQTGSPPATTQPQGSTQPHAQPASQGSGPTAQADVSQWNWLLLSDLNRRRRYTRENPRPQSPISLLAAKET